MSQNDSLITYTKSSLLGKGCYMTRVYRGTFNAIPVAVKVVNSDFFKLDKIEREISHLSTLASHPNIVSYYASQRDDDEFVSIALELCDTDLGTWVKAKHDPSFCRLDILKQASEGIAYLHSEAINIVHKDIKPANILVNVRAEGLGIKITDFGMSKRIVGEGSQFSIQDNSGVGTRGWIAPEILMWLSRKDRDGTISNKFSRKADIFSLGLVFYFVLSDGMHAFGGEFERDVNIMNHTGALLTTEQLKKYVGRSTNFLIGLETMIANYPRERPGARELLETMFR